MKVNTTHNIYECTLKGGSEVSEQPMIIYLITNLFEDKKAKKKKAKKGEEAPPPPPPEPVEEDDWLSAATAEEPVVQDIIGLVLLVACPFVCMIVIIYTIMIIVSVSFSTRHSPVVH